MPAGLGGSWCVGQHPRPVACQSHPLPPTLSAPSLACQDGTYTSGRLNSRPNGGLYPGMVLPDGRTAGSVHVEASIQVQCIQVLSIANLVIVVGWCC